jgi:uncharacterized protein YdhG (YjbR/CyaY superfamily)
MASHEIDNYIATFPENVQVKLDEIRAIIRKAAPQAEEVISYKMPAYEFHGIAVYFAGYAKHVGFYPTGSGIEAFQHRFGPYKWSKGAVQFSLDKPLPADLITEMVHFRLQLNLEKAAAKPKKK